MKIKEFNLCLNCFEPINSRIDICPHCGYDRTSAPVQPFHLEPGVLIKQRYVVGTVKDSGGFSIIYKAWDLTLKRVVVVKEYYQNRLMTRVPGEESAIVFAKGKAEFRRDIENFMLEARTVSKFLTQPNIVDVYDYFEENNTAYMIEELLDGISLQDYLKKNGGKISADEVSAIILAVLQALEEIHSKFYIHRDISPKNIFICTKDGQQMVKLIDFGAACFFSEKPGKQYPVILTPCYAPPEQYDEFGFQGPWTDLYALGATMYRCLTATFPPESQNIVQGAELILPTKLEPSVPEYMERIVLKAMATDIPLRFRRTREMAEALRNKEGVSTPKETKKRRIITSISIITGGILAAGAVAVVGGLYISGQINKDVLDPATIHVWVRYDGSTDGQKAAQARFEAMTKEFRNNEKFSSVRIKATYYPDTEYDQKLNEAFASGKNIPTLFLSDNLDDQYQSKLEPLSSVVDNIMQEDGKSYYFLNQYSKYFPQKNQVPLGFSVPVVYVYDHGSVSEQSGSTSAQKENRLTEIDSLAKMNGKDYRFYYDQALNYASGYQNKSIKDPADSANYDAANAKWYEDAHFTRSTEAFTSGELTYFLAGTDSFPLIEPQTRGKLSIIPQTAKNLYGNFTDLYSINAAADDAEKKAAKLLLQSLLGRQSENVMNYGSGDSQTYSFHNLPLNKDALKTNIEVYDLPDNIPELVTGGNITMLGSKDKAVKAECKRLTNALLKEESK